MTTAMHQPKKALLVAIASGAGRREQSHALPTDFLAQTTLVAPSSMCLAILAKQPLCLSLNCQATRSTSQRVRLDPPSMTLSAGQCSTSHARDTSPYRRPFDASLSWLHSVHACRWASEFRPILFTRPREFLHHHPQQTQRTLRSETR